MKGMAPVQNRYLKLLLYICVWLGLNVLWELRAIILYTGIHFPFLFMGAAALSFAPIVGITVLLLMVLFKSRKLNLAALIWLILATAAANPPIYLLSVSLFSVVTVLICNVYLTVIICNRDQPLRHANKISWTFAIIFVLCLTSPKLSARFAINGYATANTAVNTHLNLTTDHKNQLKNHGITTIAPSQPKVELSGVGDIKITITRIGILYFSTIGNYSYDW